MRGRPDSPIDGIMPPDPCIDVVVYPPTGMVFAPDAQITGPFDSAEINPDGSATLRGVPIRSVRQDDPQFEAKLVAGLLDARNQVNEVAQYTTPEYVGDKTRSWGTAASRYYQLCGECGGSIHWLNAPTGGWWAHDRHPDDGHDATPPRRHHDSRGECICQTIDNPPCHWCSDTCCAEHIDHCLAGFPVPCCERCPDVE